MRMPTRQPERYTVKQAMAVLGVSRRTLYNRKAAGWFDIVRNEGGQRAYIPAVQLNALLDCFTPEEQAAYLAARKAGAALPVKDQTRQNIAPTPAHTAESEGVAVARALAAQSLLNVAEQTKANTTSALRALGLYRSRLGLGE